MQLMARDEPLLPFKEVRKLGPSSAFSNVTFRWLVESCLGVLHRGLPKQLAMPSGSPRSPQTFSSLEGGVRLPE